MTLDRIPAEMRELPHWVAWKREHRGDKPTKIPYNPHDPARMAKSNDPATWASLSVAQEAFQRGAFDGLGFVFAPDDPFCGIDLDHSRDPKTGSFAPWADNLIARFSSYTEVSPSGAGAHIIIRGTLRDGKGRKTPAGTPEAIEIYDRGRYFCMTGDALSETAIQDRQGELDMFVVERFGLAQGGNGSLPKVEPSGGVDVIERARRYVEKMEASVAGQRGHDRAFAAAMVLVEGFGLSVGQAMPLMEEFNSRCSPPWSPRELDHKLRSADSKADPSKRGWKLRAGPGSINTPRPSTSTPTDAPPDAPPTPDDPFPIWVTDGKTRRLLPLNLARKISMDRRIIHVIGSFYEYASGVYRLTENYVYERLATEIIGQTAKRAQLIEVIKFMQVLTAIDASAVYHNGRIINLQNGLLDLDNGLQPHTPDHISTTQIPIAYDPAATCPTWERSMADWFSSEPDMIDLIQQWFGYCLIPDTHQHKAMILIGEGANGKSVLCNTLKALVGSENVSAVSLMSLGKPFAVAELFGKLVNLTIEADIRENMEEGIFKQVVSGDIVLAERKFMNPFTFCPFARFTIATNNLFRVDDRSEGFYRRLLIVRFNRTFAENQQDRHLTSQLMAELPGILNWSLAGLALLEEQGRFLIPQAVRNEVEEYRKSNNPVAVWVDECCELSPLLWTSTKELYKSYTTWATENGHRLMATNKFSGELKRLPGVSHAQQRVGLTMTRGFNGIRIS